MGPQVGVCLLWRVTGRAGPEQAGVDVFSDRAKNNSFHQARHPLPLAMAQVVPCVQEKTDRYRVSAWSPRHLSARQRPKLGWGSGPVGSQTAGVDVTEKAWGQGSTVP